MFAALLLPVHCDIPVGFGAHGVTRRHPAPSPARPPPPPPRAQVHCTHLDVLGDWELAVSGLESGSFETCGHVAPDRIMTSVNHHIGWETPGFATQARRVKIRLSNPNVATILGEDGSEAAKGKWTFVYDEAVDISVDGHNVRRAP